MEISRVQGLGLVGNRGILHRDDFPLFPTKH